ncbi:hypothetical protein HMI54_009018 [Coelomomyces lativittatus]|nr:hypothetical protein HMI56_004535 [Coelomomyces lativittatus]KAJ1518397.1 hypothetical protein HMI55_004702 [Coelomomyces lativittatus]KAJ1518738.1 hypothetical protein HMI54_009018 [Coelomomyces lativittatus]
MLQQLDKVEANKNDAPFQMTKEEIKKFQSAFQNKEFRDLFKNYVDEISNPENRKLYEKEIQQLEEERGNSIRWVRPNNQFVIRTKATLSTATKTSTLITNEFSGTVYINFVSSDEIQIPSSKPSTNASKIGVTWSLPHSLTLPRPDLDSNGDAIEIYDVVYHSSAYGDEKLRNMLIDIGIDSIEKKFKTKISKAFTLLKDIKCKGVPATTVIRTPTDPTSVPTSQSSSDATCSPNKKLSKSSTPKAISSKVSKMTSADGFSNLKIEEPKYEFLYQHNVDLSQFTNQREVLRSNDPLLLRIYLPKVQNASEIDFQVTESQCVLHVPELYYMLLGMPRKVDPNKVNAKWISDKKILEIICPMENTSNSKV